MSYQQLVWLSNHLRSEIMKVILSMIIYITYILNKNKTFLTAWPIDCLFDNIVERLRVSSIEQLFNNWMYEINPWNAEFDDLLFYGDQRLIPGQWIHIVMIILYKGQTTVLLLTYTWNICKNNKSLGRFIDGLMIKQCIWSQKYRNGLLTFWIWSAYDHSTMNIS